MAGSRLAGGAFGQPWSQHKTLASALLDDDADNLVLYRDSALLIVGSDQP